jgi:hypothetical protein
MTDKPRNPKKGLEEPEAAYQDADDEGLTEAEWDTWGARNKEALQASFERAEEDHKRGHFYTLEEVMARMKATIQRAAKKP